jgi:uncharacterized protein YbaR (Trm112 family)
MILECPYCHGNTYEIGIYRGMGIIYCESCRLEFFLTEPLEAQYRLN